MLRTFLGGLVFGTGFALAFLAVVGVVGYLALPRLLVAELNALERERGACGDIGTDGAGNAGDDAEDRAAAPGRDCGGGFHAGPEAEIGTPPSIAEADRYLGIAASYGHDFDHDSNLVLAAGPGRIAGLLRVDGKPLAGLRLRLALNGKAYSQWATSGPDGRYEVAVPFGDYRIDGHQLDTESANSVLGGKIGHPRNPYAGGSFAVAEGAPGEGLTLDFIDPVVVTMPKRKYAADEDVVARWRPYPGATEYAIQLWERSGPGPYGGREALFDWDKRPVVREPVANLADYGVALKPGYYYSIDVTAQTGPWEPVSETSRQLREYDFQVVGEDGGG